MSHVIDTRTVPLPGPLDRESWPVEQFSEDGLSALNILRLSALACRASARTDLGLACLALRERASVSQSSFADVLVRCLPQILGREVRFFRPGVDKASSDEAWLCRLVDATVADDSASVEFLLRSRLPRHVCRLLRPLIDGLARPAGSPSKD